MENICGKLQETLDLISVFFLLLFSPISPMTTLTPFENLFTMEQNLNGCGFVQLCLRASRAKFLFLKKMFCFTF